MTALHATAECRACEWTQTGDHADVDKAANNHTTREKHATSVCAETVIAKVPK